MKRESVLRQQLRSLDMLHEAVTAMKNLSAHHFRETRASVAPARAYRDGVQQLLAWTGATITAGTGPRGLLVIGGEMGLCGAYNARIVELGTQTRSGLGGGPTFCVGQRAAGLLARHGVPIATTYSTPTSVNGIPDLLLRLAEDMLARYVHDNLSSFHVVSSRFGGVGANEPTDLSLLPLSAPPSGPGPAIRYVQPEHLQSAALRDFLYITLYDILLDALASEHSARLLATQSAEQWLEDRTQHLRRHLAATRREASTQEMIEIAGGARALRLARQPKKR